MKSIYKTLSSLILAVILVSCSKTSQSPMLDKKDLSSFDIQPFIHNQITNDNLTITFSQHFFACPTKEWVLKDFTAGFNRFYFNFKGVELRKSQPMCHEWTRAAALYGQLCYFNSNPKPGYQLAIAEFWYHPDNTENGHAIVVFFVFNGKEPEFLFFEPQTLQEVKLTKSEILSCSLIRF